MKWNWAEMIGLNKFSALLNFSTSAISKCGVLVPSSSGWPDLAALSPERLNEMP